jgi:ubiquitin carboxyl-terminal hydrolase 48
VEDALSGEEPAKDVVIISDDETPSCSKKYCSKNPNCLNYLAQDRWEDAGMQNCQIVARLGTDNPQRPL